MKIPGIVSQGPLMKEPKSYDVKPFVSVDGFNSPAETIYGKTVNPLFEGLSSLSTSNLEIQDGHTGSSHFGGLGQSRHVTLGGPNSCSWMDPCGYHLLPPFFSLSTQYLLLSCLLQLQLCI